MFPGRPVIVPRVKSLSSIFTKAIEEKKDKLGRRNCYDTDTGKRVPCPKKEGEGDRKPAARKKPGGKKPRRPPLRPKDQKVRSQLEQADGKLPRPKQVDPSARPEQVVPQLVQVYKEKLGYDSADAINDGSCDSFAVDLARRLPGARAVWDFEETMGGDEYHMRHAFVYWQGRYYDSEHPEGVDDWRDLAEFARVRKSSMDEDEMRAVAREMERLLGGGKKPVVRVQKKPVEPPPKPRPVPAPPEPGFTGIDTLGRKWINGELQPGDPEPPKRERDPNDFDYDPKRVFKLSSLTDGRDVVVPQRIEQALVDSEIFQHFLSGALWERSPIERRLAEQHPQHMELLHKEGYLEPFYPGGKAPPWTLTTKGKLAVAKMMGVDDFADPTTMQGISQVTLFYKMLNNAERRKLLDHFGIRGEVYLRGGIPRDFDSEDFREVLFRMAERRVNPKTTFELIREDEKLQDFVAELTRLSSRDTKLREWDREMGALKEELPKHFLSTTSLALVQSRIGYLRVYVKNSPTKRKARQILAKLEDIHKRFQELQERKVAILREDSNTQYNAVSEKLRSRVQDPQAIVVTEYTDSVSERAKTNMGRTLELLEGVLQRGSVGLPPFRVYVDPNKPHRASYSYLLGNAVHLPEMSCGISSAIHELMHGVEANSPEIIQAIQEFRRGRVGDEKGVDLGNRFGLAYSTGEIGYKDRFDLAFQGDEYSAYYTGKKYDSLSTEILSMGVEKLYEDPSGFARRDPEFCAFIVGILDGTLRKKPIPDSSKQDVLIPEVIE